jgi:hypothetical protein
MSVPDVFIEKNHPAEKLARLLWQAHRQTRAAVRRALSAAGSDEMAKVANIIAADTIYGIDTIAESELINFLEAHQFEAPAFALVGEFEQGETLSFGKGQPQFRVLLDPIDGTRLLMHKKASGWILTGIAPERGESSRLADIFFALQTELPPPKQIYGDTLWASQWHGAQGWRENLLTGEQATLVLRADPATDLRHGFVSFVNLFPRGKQWLAKLEEEFLYSTVAPASPPTSSTDADLKQNGLHQPADIPIFSDQHLSSGGQLFSLMTGQLRLVADVRPLLNRYWRQRHEPTLLCAHPYDMATWLIAQKAGVALYAPDGSTLNGPTEPTDEIGWIGFSNQILAQRYLPALLHLLRRANLI